MKKHVKQLNNRISALFKINKFIFNQTLTRELILAYDKLIQSNGKDTIVFNIKTYMKTDKAIERFKKQFNNHEHIKIDNIEGTESTVTLSEEMTSLFYKKTILIKRDEEEKPFLSNIREDGDASLKNIFTLEEFLDTYDKKLINTDEEKEIIENYKKLLIKTYANEDVTQYYIITEDVEMDDIYTLNNKEETYEILPNPTIKKTILHNNIGEIFKQQFNDGVIKIKVKLTKRLSNDNQSGLILATKYQYICPASFCKKTFYKEPYQLAGDIKHICNMENKQKTSVDKNSYTISNQMNLFIYEVTIPLIKDDQQKIHIYSREHDTKTGIYEVELKKEYMSLEKRSNSRHRMLLMLSKREIKPEKKNNLELIRDGMGKKLSEELKIPHVRVMDIIQSIKDIHSEYSKDNMTTQGMWLQIATTISGVARRLYAHNKMAINVVSNRSLSKTYSASRIAIMLDDEFHFQETTDLVSLTGLTGGINTAKMINGVVSRVFEEGMISKYGLTIFDEASIFFSDPDWSKRLKTFFSKEINIEKTSAGGARQLQKYTPILLSNFNGTHASKYKENVMKQYVNLYKSKGEMINDEKKRKIFVNMNYYLPLSDYTKQYSDEQLTIAFKIVREEYQSRDIDWRTGTEMATVGRILMDVVVENKKKRANLYVLAEEDINKQSTTLEIPDVEYIPREQFLIELEEKYLCGKKIDLLVDRNNTDKKIEKQLDKLQYNVEVWLSCTMQGLKIKSSLGEDRELDDKLEKILIKVIQTVQLIEDINSTTLSTNVKEWLNIFLLKCKRGMTEEEYNYEMNKTEYVPDTIDIGGIDFQLEQLRKKDRDKREVREELLQEQQEKAEKNNVLEFIEEGETYKENTEEDLVKLMEAIE